MKRLLILASLALASHAQADDGMSTGSMLTGCKAALHSFESQEIRGSQFDMGKCLGFISGARDMLAVWKESQPTVAICQPQKAQTIQIVRVFVKWADDHPESHHEIALLSFIQSMREAFPCDQ